MGANDYLNKPFSADELTEKINNWIQHPSQRSSVVINDSTKCKCGVPDIDEQFFGGIHRNSHILLTGHIGSGKSLFARQFMMEGIRQQEHCLLLSLDDKKAHIQSSMKLNTDQSSLLTIHDASNWTGMTGQPWRNLDYIYDRLTNECESSDFTRIVIDSISSGLAFWTTQELLQFINLCSQLPNAENRCTLWCFNSHPSINDIEYHVSQSMDIGIELQQHQDWYSGQILFSKWQRFSNVPIRIQN